jgi:hypothetical protein
MVYNALPYLSHLIITLLEVVCMSKKEIRSEFIGGKVTPSVKAELKILKKTAGITVGDIVENFVKNKSNINSHEMLTKQKMLKKEKNLIKRIKKSLDEEDSNIDKEIKRLSDLRPVGMTIDDDAEKNIKDCVKAFFRIKNQHINSFGVLNPEFNPLLIGKTLSGRYDIDPLILTKSIEIIDNGVDLNDFLSTDLSDYGLI